MTSLAILGASGHGKVVAECALAAGWSTIVYFDDAWPRIPQRGQWPVAGGRAELLAASKQFDGVIVAIGNNAVREAQVRALLAVGSPVVSIIHPAAWVSPSASLGVGSVVVAGAIVNAEATVGLGGILNTGCSVDHDCSLGVCVHVSPGARLAGAVKVGDRCWIGIGSCIRQGQQIGNDAVVGAGAVVVSDVAAGVTVIGVPAVPLRKN